MVLEMIVEQSDDGYTAEIPSLSGCDTWAATEDEAIDKIIELARFYLNLPDSEKMKIDKARGNFKKKIYKIIFNKYAS